MNALERFVKGSIEGGWSGFDVIGYGDTHAGGERAITCCEIKTALWAFMEPEFWKCAGKCFGWGETWQEKQVGLMRHVSNEGDIMEYLEGCVNFVNGKKPGFAYDAWGNQIGKIEDGKIIVRS